MRDFDFYDVLCVRPARKEAAVPTIDPTSRAIFANVPSLSSCSA